MRFYHSVRWQLQLWHGLLLVLVLAGFGLTAWEFQRANQMRSADRELEQRMGIVEDSQLLRREQAPGSMRWSPREQRLFEGVTGKAYYYAVWLRDGRQTVVSQAAPSGIPVPERLPGPPVFRTRGTLRECFHDIPSGECVLVGRNIGDELTGLRRTAWLLAGSGGAVLLLGLAGGHWIASRALRPIDGIRETARQISDGDLSRRIYPTGSKNELALLARDLNTTFARLQASFTRQAQFTADASHELRTPVAVILTQAQAALTRERSPDEYRESLAACQRAAQRMRGLIESLLVLARFDSEEAREPAGICDLSRIAAESVSLHRPMAGEKNVRLSLEASPVECPGFADDLALVVGNLVGNAISYNRPGGSVRVKVHRDADNAILTVSDTGQGISPDDFPHIFERFYRAEKSRAAGREHAGLGLAITKAIVEKQGGTINVTSEPGIGTVFCVRFAVVSNSRSP